MVRTKTAVATLALACLVACSAGLVLLASGRPSVLVPPSAVAFPGWLAGPLHPLTQRIALRPEPTQLVLSGALLAMALACCRSRCSAVSGVLGCCSARWRRRPSPPC